MNPYKGVLGQAVALLLSSTMAWAFSPPVPALAILLVNAIVAVAAVMLAVPYLIGRLRAPRGLGDRWRLVGDLLLAAETVLPVALLATIVSLAGSGPLSTVPLSREIATFFGLLSAMLAVFVISSAIDWLWILPRRDGLVCPPPCKTSGDPKWADLTKTWLRHRLVAESAFVVFFLVTGPVIALQAYTGESSAFQWFAKVVGPVMTAFGLAFGYSKSRLLVGTSGMRGVNSSAKFALGDTISWATPRGHKPKRVGEWRSPFLRGRRVSLTIEQQSPKPQPAVVSEGRDYYVFDVALDEATLFKVRAKRDPSGYMKEYKADMSVLMTSGVVHRGFDSPCLAACLRMQTHCARRGEAGAAQ